MMKDKQDPFSGMSLEELWQLFPVFLTEHRQVWAQTPGKLRAAMKALGFADVFEVAVGADLCATQEAIDFIREVPEKLPFMATSCCPAWSMMAKKLFPEHADCISMALTPMTLTARLIKRHHSNAKVVFIGPCAAKKLEAMRTDIRSDVDFVLTFEEMDGIFDARHVDMEKIEEDPEGVNDASADGRNFAVAGGVAKSVVDVIHERYPEKEIKVANAEGLKECRKLLTMAKAGKYNGKAKHKTSNETEHVKELDKAGGLKGGNLSNFTRRFKSSENMTPGQYRNLYGSRKKV